MVENVVQFKSGLMINVNVNAKIQENTVCLKKNYILRDVLVQMVNISEVLLVRASNYVR